MPVSIFLVLALQVLGSMAGFCFFQAGAVTHSSLQLLSSESLLCSLASFISEDSVFLSYSGLVKLVSFRDFLK